MKDTDNEAATAGVFQSCLNISRHSILDAIIRSFDFLGRTSRRSFWIAFLLFGFCAVYLKACEIWLIDWGLGDFEIWVSSTLKSLRNALTYLLFPLVVRRFHDQGLTIGSALNPLSSRWFLLGPVAGLFEPGDSEENAFGPPHKL